VRAPLCLLVDGADGEEQVLLVGEIERELDTSPAVLNTRVAGRDGDDGGSGERVK
jgi:hypothetical protein